jgi:NADPH-dependent 2,4-dienoyl-CoA reductase/sulfur reductase-like enzyme
MVLIVGAGPAGLATAASLAQRGIPYRLLERGDSLGHSWTQLYDSLRLHTGKHLSHLPGLPFGRGVSLFPTRDEFLAYLARYAERYHIEVTTGADVRRIERRNGAWWAHTAGDSSYDAAALVMATGIIANPRRAVIPGAEAFRGRIMHSVEYRRPDEFLGRRVLIVGVGNSGGEIGAELARAGARVSVAVRSGANVVPLTLGGVPIQYLAWGLRRLPRSAREAIVRQVQRAMERRHGPPVLPRPGHSPLDAIPLIGLHLVSAIREGLVTVRPGSVTLTPTGAHFSDGSADDFDVVVLATGFRPALAALEGLLRTDARGFAVRNDRVTSADHGNLFFVGHNYDSSGGLANIRRDAQLVAGRIAR